MSGLSISGSNSDMDSNAHERAMALERLDRKTGALLLKGASAPIAGVRFFAGVFFGESAKEADQVATNIMNRAEAIGAQLGATLLVRAVNSAISLAKLRGVRWR